MARTARYTPAAIPSAEDEEFQRHLDAAPADAFTAMVRHLAALAKTRRPD